MQNNIAIELTRLCDKACKHCGTNAKHTKKYDLSSMDMHTIIKILEQIKWTNKNKRMTKIKTVHLTGGEPFMWQENGHRTTDAIKAIQYYGFEPQILTSGTFPKDRGFKRYIEGVEDLDKLNFFDVFHSFNLYMAGTDIAKRTEYTIGLFDELLGSDRELGFFGVYDRSNRVSTLKAFDSLMEKLGFVFIKSRSTRNWKEKSRKGEYIELIYKKGKRDSVIEFLTVDACAGRSRKFSLRPVRAKKICYLLDGEEGIQPVIGYIGDVYPCWGGPYPDTRPLGNIHKDDLSTILGRESVYLEAFKECIDADYNKKIDVCMFCVDISKDCLSFQFQKD